MMSRYIRSQLGCFTAKVYFIKMLCIAIATFVVGAKVYSYRLGALNLPIQGIS